MWPHVFAKVLAAPFSVNGTSNLAHGMLRRVKFIERLDLCISVLPETSQQLFKKCVSVACYLNLFFSNKSV